MRNLYPHHQEPSKETLSTLRSGAHTRYNVNYHMVWIPKYRKKVLVGRNRKQILEEIIRGNCADNDWGVLAYEAQPDHIHLFVSVPPSTPASKVANQLKGVTSIQLRRIFPELKREMGTKTRFATSLWADGYYVSTAGYISEDKIKKYIDEQSKQEKRQSVVKAIREKLQKTLYQPAPHSHPAVNNGVSLGSC